MPDIASLFLSSAFAATPAEAAASPSATDTSIMGAFVHTMEAFLFGPRVPAVITILVLAYFMLIRPQQVRELRHNFMLKNLKIGDQIVTGGGVVGTISAVEGDLYLIVEIADRTHVKILRSTISELAPKPAAPTPPVADKKD